MSAGFGFGSGNTTQPSGSNFGSNNANNTSQSSVFGQTPQASVFGQTPQTPSFGQPATTQAQDTANTRPAWSIGSSVNTDPFKPSTTGTGTGFTGTGTGFTGTGTGFTGTGLFGNAPSTTNATFGFGQSKPTSTPFNASSFGGFSGPSTSTSPFGSTANFGGFKLPTADSGKAQITTAPTTTAVTLGLSKPEATQNFSLFGSAKNQSGSNQPAQDTNIKETLGFGINAASKPTPTFNAFGLSTTTKTTQGQGTSSGLFPSSGFSNLATTTSSDATKTTSNPSPFGGITTPPGGLNLFSNLGTSSASSTQPNLFSTPSTKKDGISTTTSVLLSHPSTITSKPSLSSFIKTQQQPAPVTSSASVNSAIATTTTTTQASMLSTSLSFSTPSLSQPKTSIPQAKTSAPIITSTLSTPTTSTTSIVKPGLSIPVTTATTSAPDQIPSWLKNNNIEGIIRKWTTDLDNCTKKFHNQVREVNQWDQKIIENNGRVTRLGEQISKAASLQDEMNISLNNVEARQQELEKFLSEYEEKFGDPSLEAMKPLDKEREKTYELAESINQELDNMSQVLSAMITDINRGTSTLTTAPPEDEDEAMNEVGEDPIDEVVKILNSHLTSLQWIDATANQLSARVQEAQSFLDHAQGP